MFLRLYRLLLHLYPTRVRDRYGEEMVWFLRDARAEAGGRGRLAVACFYVRAVRDVLVNGVSERWESRHRSTTGERRGGAGMEVWMQDLRYAVRAFVRRPVFAGIGVLTLAIGIGGNTLIFSVVEAVLVRPLPYDEPDRVVVLNRRGPDDEGTLRRVAYSDPAFLALQEANRGFEGLAAFTTFPTVAGGEDRPFQTTVTAATSGLWKVLGVEARLGRTFGSDDDDPGVVPVVLLSHRLWMSRYGGDPGVLGRSMTLGVGERTIVGVLPADFLFLDERVELWVPLPIDPARFVANAALNNNRTVVGRLPKASDETIAGVLAETQRGAASVALMPSPTERSSPCCRFGSSRLEAWSQPCLRSSVRWRWCSSSPARISPICF